LQVRDDTRVGGSPAWNAAGHTSHADTGDRGAACLALDTSGHQQHHHDCSRPHRRGARGQSPTRVVALALKEPLDHQFTIGCFGTLALIVLIGTLLSLAWLDWGHCDLSCLVPARPLGVPSPGPRLVLGLGQAPQGQPQVQGIKRASVHYARLVARAVSL